jgi:superfamily II DNA or RNA helicase
MPETFAPLPHQEECLEALARARREKRNRSLVVMASGLGKTVTAAHLAKREVGRTKKKVLFLVHQNDILTQARATFEVVIGGPASRYGFFHGREKNRHKVQFLFASFQTMRDWRTEFA